MYQINALYTLNLYNVEAAESKIKEQSQLVSGRGQFPSS